MAFSPDAEDIVLLRTQGRHRVIKDWRAAQPRQVLPNVESSSVEFPSRALFFRNGNALLVASQLAPTAAPRVGRPSPFATVIRDWQSEYAWKAGEIHARLDRDPESDVLFNRGDITSLGVRDDGLIVSTDAAAQLTIWEPFFRFGSAKVRFGGPPDIIGLHPAGTHALVALDLNQGLSVESLQGYDSPFPSQSQLFPLPGPTSRSLRRLAVSRDLKLIATITEDDHKAGNRITLYSVETKSSVRVLVPPDTDRNEVSDWLQLEAIAFDATGRYLVANHGDGRMFVWDLQVDPKIPATVFRLSNVATSNTGFVFSHKDELLIVLFGNEIQVWKNWQSQNPVRWAQWRAPKEAGSIVAAAVSPHDDYLAAGTEDGQTFIWKRWQENEWQLVSQLTTPKDPDREDLPARLLDLAFHPTVNILVSLDRRGLEVLDLDAKDRGSFRLKRKTPRYTSASVAFSPDGRYIVSMGRTPGDYVLWLWQPKDLIQDACSSFVLEELSNAQWQEYIKVLPQAPACALPTR